MVGLLLLMKGTELIAQWWITLLIWWEVKSHTVLPCYNADGYNANSDIALVYDGSHFYYLSYKILLL
jgi:hypothetical protein